MVFNTLTVGAAVTPSVIETYFSHYLNRAPLRHKPTAHISYHEGLRLIRQFLDYSSKHTVEDIQAFTAQWVPAPHWVRINDAEIAPKFLEQAARLLQSQLGHRGLELIGGKTWWQWRRPDTPLRAEWIEMKKEYHERNRTGRRCERVILYVHGGAYYFGSVDEHRYQMQRHARKLRAQVLSPRYRLAPQFPFPCGLLDCLATYYYLLQHFSPSQILFAGDSAGGGMVLSMLVTLRDQGQPLPSGTILLSPWVDLSHSFPSVAGDGIGDYIPPHGFHHRPSMAWPPPATEGGANAKAGRAVSDNAIELPGTAGLNESQRGSARNGGRSGDDEELSALPQQMRPKSEFGEGLRIILDGQTVELNEQIQMYTTNALLAHPLVSPVMQPSLGGLPPMLIQTGGAELLKDEQVYLAHKAANPRDYPPSETVMREFDPQRKALEKWPPTDVQLQVWDDLCHVPHTLSFTRPAKYMYRSVAQFGAWALAHAQKHGISIQNDDAISVISSGREDEDEDGSSVGDSDPTAAKAKSKSKQAEAVGKAGDPLPPFKDHMIRQRVTRHGVVYQMAPESEIAALALDPATIGVPKPGPVRKWLALHQSNEQKFANERKRVEKKRAKELAQGYDEIPGERPPLTALVNRRRGGVAPEEKKRGRSWGLAMWSGWGSSHDEQTLQKEQKSVKEAMRKQSAASALELGRSSGQLPTEDSAGKRRRASSVSAVRSGLHTRWASSRDRERARTPDASMGMPRNEEVVDSGQAGSSSVTEESPVSTTVTRANRPFSNSINSPIPLGEDMLHDTRNSSEAPIAIVPTTSITSPSSEKVAGTDHTYLSPTGSRPHNGVQAYPFKLKDAGAKAASTMTLDSQVGVNDATGTSTPHSELMGDSPLPVELPSSYVRNFEHDNVPNHGEPDDRNAGLPLQTQSSAIHPPVENLSAIEQQPSEGRGRAVETHVENIAVGQQSAGNITPKEDSAIDEESATDKAPFKLRNPVFDQRTSMLGSIGADGMPNAHYAFLRDESPKREALSGVAIPEPGKVDENVKAAPFKIRHTIYEPDITLGSSKTVDHSLLPEHADWLEARNGSPADSAVQRESGVLGAQMNDQRIVGDQREQPASSLNPTTQTAMSQKPMVKAAEDESEKPPPPPPKDENYLPVNRKVTGLRKPKQSSSSVSGSTAPAIGDLSFEKAD